MLQYGKLQNCIHVYSVRLSVLCYILFAIIVLNYFMQQYVNSVHILETKVCTWVNSQQYSDL